MHASKTLIQKIALELSDVANDNSFLLLQITFLRIFRNSHTVFQMCVFSNLIFCKLSYLYCQEVEQGWVGPFFAACPGRGLPKCVASHTSQVFVLFSTVFGLFLRCGSLAGSARSQFYQECEYVTDGSFSPESKCVMSLFSSDKQWAKIRKKSVIWLKSKIL